MKEHIELFSSSYLAKCPSLLKCLHEHDLYLDIFIFINWTREESSQRFLKLFRKDVLREKIRFSILCFHRFLVVNFSINLLHLLHLSTKQKRNIILFLVQNSFITWRKSCTWFSFYFESCKVLRSPLSFNTSLHLSGSMREQKSFHYFIQWMKRKENKKCGWLFNILISKWSRNLTTGHNEMKSDIYGVYGSIVFLGI